MRYVSTRGRAPTLDFDDVLLTGLARDGGLYVPEAWPTLSADDLRRLRGRPYAEVAAAVLRPFLAGSVVERDLDAIAAETYAGFDHAAVAPLVQLDQRLWLLELFHGPTIAFKDYALQLLGRLFDRVLAARGRRMTVVGATSGDTGSAAIEACRDRDAVDIFILYPRGRVSEVQRRQMTTVPSRNVHTIAIDGSFDDCQDLVKALFNDPDFRDETGLAAVNSINWARIVAQSAYYVAAAVALGAPDRPVAFSVPTGNFGNVYAAWVARSMGLPIPRLVVGANTNDILDRFFRTGEMKMEPVVPTLSPSMDIQISSNFERLLFELADRDAETVAQQMQTFRSERRFAVDPRQLATAREVFSSARLDDAGTLETIALVRRATGQTIDPHTAVGLAAARSAESSIDPAVPIVTLGCAHPAKFPDAVEKATGVRPPLPEKLADLFDRPERSEDLPNDLAALQRHIRERIGATGAAA